MAEQRHRQHPSQGRSPKQNRRSPCGAAAASTRQHHRTYREPFGDLVQKNREENQPSQPVGNQETTSDRDSVEEGVNNEPQNHRVTLMPMDELIVVRLFPKVKVWGDRVLEKMNDEIAEQNQQRRGLPP